MLNLSFVGFVFNIISLMSKMVLSLKEGNKSRQSNQCSSAHSWNTKLTSLPLGSHALSAQSFCRLLSIMKSNLKINGLLEFIMRSIQVNTKASAVHEWLYVQIGLSRKPHTLSLRLYVHCSLCSFSPSFISVYSCIPQREILQRVCSYIVTKAVLSVARWYSACGGGAR